MEETPLIKVRQQLNDQARKERKRLSSGGKRGVYEYRVDSNRMAELALDKSPESLKPLLRKEMSLSQILSSNLFSAGSIPSNREIEEVVDTIRRFRSRSTSEDSQQGCSSTRMGRRHSDVTDLRSSKRSIRDGPRYRDRSSSLGHERRRGSGDRCNNTRLPGLSEEDDSGSLSVDLEGGPSMSSVEQSPSPDIMSPEIPLLSDMCASPDHLPQCEKPLPSILLSPSPSRVSPISWEAESPEPSPAPSPTPVSPLSFMDSISSPELSPAPSPIPSPHSPDRAEPFRLLSSRSVEGLPQIGFSVRNPTFPRSSSPPQLAEDLVLHHTLLRRSRHRHRRCSQPWPCLGHRNSVTEQQGMLHGTHPRADLCLISCPGNHPPVSYLSASKRSMHVHHVPFPQREEEDEEEDEVFAPDHATMTEALQSVLSKSEGFVLNKDLPDKDQQRGSTMEKSLDFETLTVAPSIVLDGNGKRDSGYGDSTSTSREALHSTKSSSSLLSRLKPLLNLGKKKQPPVIDETNPFHRIFEERPLSELRKSLDSLIAERRSSLPGIKTLPPLAATIAAHKSPDCKSPHCKSPACKISPEYHPSDEIMMEEFDSLFGSLSSSQQVPEVAIAGSEDEEEFRISPLPLDPCFEGHNTALPMIPSICRQNSLEFNLREESFSLQDIQEILDSVEVTSSLVTGHDKVHNMLQSRLTVSLGAIYETLRNCSIPHRGFNAREILENILKHVEERLELLCSNTIPSDPKARRGAILKVQLLANLDLLLQLLLYKELIGLLESFEVLMEVHDTVISRSYCENETLPGTDREIGAVVGGVEEAKEGPYRMVGLHKRHGESLGITLKKEGDAVVVHRILAGGMIDRQKLLHIGDVIVSINDHEVKPQPEVIQQMLREQQGDIHLKIIPSYREQSAVCQVFVKAHFSYDPKTDDLMPCKQYIEAYINWTYKTDEITGPINLYI
eukprot:sb/3461722/